VFTAVRKPKVISVPTMSLSIVLGTPMMFTPASTSGAALAMVPSPPITMTGVALLADLVQAQGGVAVQAGELGGVLVEHHLATLARQKMADLIEHLA